MPLIPPSPFIVVDGSSYLFRAYHALPPLTAPNGQPTGAIYGVVNMLKKLLAEYHPTHMVVVFDARGENFRHTLYPEYKANRDSMPEELAQQIEPLFEIIQAMGLPLLQMPGIEADDIIATLAKQANSHKTFCLISTIDKDLAQLVTAKTVLINTMTGKMLDPNGVREKFGVGPEQIRDYLALVGDTSDNIPGVAKVGPKTAAKWLAEYKTLEDLLENSDKISGKVGESLRACHDLARLSQQLTTLKQDIPIKTAFTDWCIQPEQTETLRNLFKALAFKTWSDQLPIPENALQEQKKHSTYHTILTKAQLEQYCEKTVTKKILVFHLETKEHDPCTIDWVGLAISHTPNQSAYIPLSGEKSLDKQTLIACIKPILQDNSIQKITHNLKASQAILETQGVKLAGPVFDIMLESYLFNPTATRHDLASLALHYLQVDKIQHISEQAEVILRLHFFFWAELLEHSAQANIFNTIEIPLVSVLVRMEQNGVCLDAEKLNKQSKILEKQLTTLEQQAQTLAKVDFNLNSPKQLQEILFEKMGLPVLLKTPKGQPSTSEAVLSDLAYDHEIAKVVLEYRSLSKLKSTYTDKLPLQIHPTTHRVHANYHQAVTATGRLSCSDPNLQNIPIRTESGRKIRQAFIAPKGTQILSADYSQIELRLMAHLSQDPSLLRAFEKGEDIHQSTAAQIFEVSVEAVNPQQRRSAKAINFGLMYGMSAFGLAKQLDLTQNEAQAYMDLYFKRFPGVLRYMEKIREFAKEKGYVETLQGRRLYLPEIHSKNRQRKRAAERAAINAPLQGSAADLIKIAMIQIDKWIQTENIKAKMIMQVHDELVFEVEQAHSSKIGASIKTWMENAEKFSVPLEVAVGIGPNWESAHE